MADDLSENVWKTMKHIVSNENQLLTNRHVDQQILCAIYGISRVMK